jgi:hypothetical protein
MAAGDIWGPGATGSAIGVVSAELIASGFIRHRYAKKTMPRHRFL